MLVDSASESIWLASTKLLVSYITQLAKLCGARQLTSRPVAMPIVLPSQAALSAAFSPVTSYGRPKTQTPKTGLRARESLYSAWSVADDAKAKTNQLSDAAVQEFEKASSKAQSAAGKIELYSPKFYAACTFGGLLACVSMAGRS